MHSLFIGKNWICGNSGHFLFILSFFSDFKLWLLPPGGGRKIHRKAVPSHKVSNLGKKQVVAWSPENTQFFLNSKSWAVPINLKLRIVGNHIAPRQQIGMLGGPYSKSSINRKLLVTTASLTASMIQTTLMATADCLSVLIDLHNHGINSRLKHCWWTQPIVYRVCYFPSGWKIRIIFLFCFLFYFYNKCIYTILLGTFHL